MRILWVLHLDGFRNEVDGPVLMNDETAGNTLPINAFEIRGSGVVAAQPACLGDGYGTWKLSNAVGMSIEGMYFLHDSSASVLTIQGAHQIIGRHGRPLA